MCCIFGSKLKMYVMKKFVIFLSLAMIFLFVGCQKEDICPNSRHETATDSSNEKGLKNPGTNDEDDGKPIDTITDPNHDEDEDDKTKR